MSKEPIPANSSSGRLLLIILIPLILVSGCQELEERGLWQSWAEDIERKS
jgi:hypothetical protein